jgi:hypothetical protein
VRPRARAATVRFSEHENARSSPLRNNSSVSGRSSFLGVFRFLLAADSSSRARRAHCSRRVRVDRTRAHACRSTAPRAAPGGEPSEGTPGGRALAMAEVKPEEGEPGAEGEEVARKEHDVSIVLSFMNDEHEKVAIEVRRGKRRRMRARALDEPSGFLRVAALRPAREIRLSIWNSTWNDEPTIHSHVRVVRGDVRFSRRSMFATAWARLTDASRDSPSTRPTRVRSCARCRKRARRSISTRSTRTWRRRSRKGTTRGTRVRA